MHIKILSPIKEIFNGDASLISLEGVNGKFQILNNHAPIICFLKQGKLLIKIKNKPSELNKNNYIRENLLELSNSDGLLEMNNKNELLILLYK